ncbi:hypothetical protein [Desertibaculum subflavum]|uniref:hypothetical protein n=1 Tax=Desertibaculum subflavum TaxID=2268458 RepID=UPI000E66948B
MDPVKKRIWEAAAAREGRTLSAWLTRAGDTAQAARPYLTPEDIAVFDGLREQLRRAGVNLNVLLRCEHAFEQGRGRRPPDREQFEEVQKDLKEALARTLAVLQTKA